MAQLIDQPTASESAAIASEDANLTHPSWCDPAQCWAHPASEDKPAAGKQPAPGGFHASRDLVVTTDYHEVHLQLVHDHGRPTQPAYLELTVGDPDDGTTRHFTVEQAEMLRGALDVLLPPRGYAGGVVKAYELGIRQGERRAAARASGDDVVEAFRLGVDVERIRADRASVSPDTLTALQRIKKALDDAEIDRRKAYADGYVDALDGREPTYEVNR